MEQDSDESGLKSLNVIRYWQYVLKDKTHRNSLSCVIAKPIDNRTLALMGMWEKYIQLGAMSEQIMVGPTTFMMRESLDNENSGEFWSKIDYLYCEKDDPMQYLAGACGVTCITDSVEFFNVVQGMKKPQSIDRVEAFERVKNLLT